MCLIGTDWQVAPDFDWSGCLLSFCQKDLVHGLQFDSSIWWYAPSVASCCSVKCVTAMLVASTKNYCHEMVCQLFCCCPYSSAGCSWEKRQCLLRVLGQVKHSSTEWVRRWLLVTTSAAWSVWMSAGFSEPQRDWTHRERWYSSKEAGAAALIDQPQQKNTSHFDCWAL